MALRAPLTLKYTGNNEIRNSYSPSDSSVISSTTTVAIMGDWDNGVGPTPDGPYIGKADEGDSKSATDTQPYYYWYASTTGSTLFSPNRMMPSAGMFGSLPTGVFSNKPWQTLLFCPNPLQGNTHPGIANPPDFALLDLFNMPVVEPYAISEPLSTAGKINMNYEMAPFSYITRATGIYAILKSELLISIPDSCAANYKQIANTSSMTTKARWPINITETLKGFQARFDNHDIFRTAGEICSLYLVPNDGDSIYAGMTNYWTTRRLTGANSRVRPYTTIYPRLTTKSNTFTVHMRVQILKQPSNATPNEWTENPSKIVSEYRGSATIERYVDPNDADIPDYATNTSPAPLDSFYKFRIIGTKQFTP